MTSSICIPPLHDIIIPLLHDIIRIIMYSGDDVMLAIIIIDGAGTGHNPASAPPEVFLQNIYFLSQFGGHAADQRYTAAFPGSPSWDTWGFAADNLPGAAAPAEPESDSQIVTLEAKLTLWFEKELDKHIKCQSLFPTSYVHKT